MRMSHQINKSSPDICFLPHPALGTEDTDEGDTSSISQSGWGWHHRAVQQPHRVWSPGLEEGVLPRQARAREGKDQEDLSEILPSRLFVTSSDNDSQLLWNMTNL